ncbi:hypothetical protein MBLNU230_g2766t1 [Neophaeotheca triangularis]
MAPKSPWNKKGNAKPNDPQSPGAEPVLPPINYAEVQSEEAEVLKAIYMEDYQEVEVKGAWSKTTDRSFKLTLRSISDPDNHVLLSVRLTATYPKSPPLLEVSGLEGYHERTQKRIRNIIKSRPTQMLKHNDVMIHDIATEIQDALEDAVQARQMGTLPSLEDERANAEEAAISLAKEAEEAELRRQREVQDEEARVLQEMVHQEVTRRDKRKSTRTESEAGPPTAVTNDEDVTFDQTCTLQTDTDILHFTTVSIVGQEGKALLGKPKSTQSARAPLVALKKVVLRDDKAAMLELETMLERVRAIRHPNVLSLQAYRIDRPGGAPRLTVCTEHANRGSLADLFELGPLHLSKGRQFVIGLLEGLDFCHRNGIPCGVLDAEHVMISGSPALVPKLASVGYDHLLHVQVQTPDGWLAPEEATCSIAALKKVDVWQLGTVASQILLDPSILHKYTSPLAMLDRLELSDSCNDLLQKMFTKDTRRRPSPFDLLPSQFLRTDGPVYQETLHAPSEDRVASGSGFGSPLKRRSRHNSSIAMEPLSRYAQDFTEINRLGKGGFGEVVKVRNKLDGGVYAVKKVKQLDAQLDQVLSEVMLLNRLNHPYVVRYFSTWVEQETSGPVFEDGSSVTETTEPTASEDPGIEFESESGGALDFVSSNGYPKIGLDGESEDEVVDEDDLFDRDEENLDEESEAAVESADTSQAAGVARTRRQRSDSKKMRSTLYIQMEFCERRTLRDLVRKGLGEDDAWRFARQITEGLAHVHSHGIIHRDLKPDNIFIDVAGNPKIGDFGLATTSQYHPVDRVTPSGNTNGDMTRSVGTTLYVAPELRSDSGSSYNDKVDMYSLGIMFYEMCEPFGTAMERIRSLQAVRERKHELPEPYRPGGDKAAQGVLVECLVSHKSSERPSSHELLRSDKLPVKIEDETIRQALSGLADSRSPYHQKMMSALFSSETNRVKAYAWDAKGTASGDTAARSRLRSTLRTNLETVFRRHGAEEGQRLGLFPKSEYYDKQNVVQLLDASGNVLQLPYDLTLPHARQLSRQPLTVRRSYAFGSVYRDPATGGPPRVNEEADFDIASNTGQDLALDDAEALKVMDEISEEVPALQQRPFCFHLNHSLLLDAVLEYCRVPQSQFTVVKEVLGRIGIGQWTWTKVRAELRSSTIALPATTLDDLAAFEFREIPKKAFSRVKTLLESANPRVAAKAEAGILHLNRVLEHASQLSVYRSTYVMPLCSFNGHFYKGGILFQCLHEKKASRDIFAAGGRYDSLIESQQPMGTTATVPKAVGISIALDRLVLFASKESKPSSKSRFLKDANHQETPQPKRSDVLIVASGSPALQATGTKLLAALWASNISAELTTQPPDPSTSAEHSFLATLKHEASQTLRFTKTTPDTPGPSSSDVTPTLSNPTATQTDRDIPLTSLIPHIQTELRENSGGKPRHNPPLPASLLRQSSHHNNANNANPNSPNPSDPASSNPAASASRIQVLLSHHRSKKSNKYAIVDSASHSWNAKLEAWKTEAPILAVETRDDVLEFVRAARLSEAESWRKAVQGVQLSERQYVQQVQGVLAEWRKRWSDGEGGRVACVFNFRTGGCVYYDLGL